MGRGDYSREAIALNISVKRGGINRGTAIIRGNTVTRDIYLSWTYVHLANLVPKLFSFSNIAMAHWKTKRTSGRG